MNSVKTLYERFGVVAEVDGMGRITFSNVGRCLSAVNGDKQAWEEVRRLMVDVEEHGKEYLRKDEKLVITGDRQTLILYPSEVRKLLTMDSDLYVKALKRGKALRRMTASERRRFG